MRIGLMVGSDKERSRADRLTGVLDDGRTAETQGFASFWFPQVPGYLDAMTAVALLGQVTDRAGVERGAHAVGVLGGGDDDDSSARQHLEELDQRLDPGIAPSRLNANVIREADVMQEVAQKNCAEAEMNSTKPPQLVPMAWVKM